MPEDVAEHSGSTHSDEAQPYGKTLQAVFSDCAGMAGALLPILHEIQDRIGFVPPETLPVVAEHLNVSRAEVHGVVSFYHYFRTSPAGRHTVQICRSESCQAVGSRALESLVRARLGIDFHETTPDGRVTLEPVYCLGNCACSPSVRIGERVVGRVDPARFDELLGELE